MKAFALVLSLLLYSMAFARPKGGGGGGCIPDCTNQECGSNGCGGVCGHCGSGLTCQDGQCICTPHCSGKQCGSDGCGGICGTCGSGTVCSGAQCVCAPQCSGKQCGPDGCGGTCGTCAANESCSGSVCILNAGGGGGGGGTTGTLITLPLCQEWQGRNSGSPILSTELQDWEMFPDSVSAYPRGAACDFSPDCAARYFMSPRNTSRTLDWGQQVTAYGVIEEQCRCGARASCPEAPTNSRTLWIRPLVAQAVSHSSSVLQFNGEVDNIGDSLVRGEVTYSARVNDGRTKCLSAPVAVIEMLKDNGWVDVASTPMTCCNTTAFGNECATRFDTAVVQAIVPANSIVRMEVRWSEAQNPSYPDDLIVSDALLFGAQCFANPDPHGAMCQ